ncbi:hypothetical protein D5018_12135 [Parashewanella curva]|uniref:Uncharacterized protein n=1 Tax=Parashewanella curva TaxID=2338552 RepID=A0A3L8PVU4_9GAMM|nr:hypothetical protein [Parashewanella curva]RLV59444.1 hypothetical protein D5018_12135 [Parashewanella curva]
MAAPSSANSSPRTSPQPSPEQSPQTERRSSPIPDLEGSPRAGRRADGQVQAADAQTIAQYGTNRSKKGEQSIKGYKVHDLGSFDAPFGKWVKVKFWKFFTRREFQVDRNELQNNLQQISRLNTHRGMNQNVTARVWAQTYNSQGQATGKQAFVMNFKFQPDGSVRKVASVKNFFTSFDISGLRKAMLRLCHKQSAQLNPEKPLIPVFSNPQLQRNEE